MIRNTRCLTALCLKLGVLSSTALGAQVSSPGNYNWVLNPSNGHYYALTAPLTWPDAAVEADVLGPEVELATVRDVNEQHWLWTHIANQNQAWIGYSDAQAEGNWVWRSGESTPFWALNGYFGLGGIPGYWLANQPDNATGNGESYCHMSTLERWNDAGGFNELNPAILEWIPPSGLNLAQSGSCPGAVTLTITGASPNGLLAVLYGRPGSFTKLTPPCSGLVLGLARPALAALIPADSQGSASLNFQAPVGACGRSVQCVDVQSCTTTNLIVL